jgi:hypothetical protein
MTTLHTAGCPHYVAASIHGWCRRGPRLADSFQRLTGSGNDGLGQRHVAEFAAVALALGQAEVHKLLERGGLRRVRVALVHQQPAQGQQRVGEAGPGTRQPHLLLRGGRGEGQAEESPEHERNKTVLVHQTTPACEDDEKKQSTPAQPKLPR